MTAFYCTKTFKNYVNNIESEFNTARKTSTESAVKAADLWTTARFNQIDMHNGEHPALLDRFNELAKVADDYYLASKNIALTIKDIASDINQLSSHTIEFSIYGQVSIDGSLPMDRSFVGAIEYVCSLEN